jgi:hypothetical protein
MDRSCVVGHRMENKKKSPRNTAELMVQKPLLPSIVTQDERLLGLCPSEIPIRIHVIAPVVVVLPGELPQLDDVFSVQAGLVALSYGKQGRGQVQTRWERGGRC